MRFTDLWEIRPQPRPEAVVQGEGYRVSVLTDRLLRLEYEKDNHFCDSATQMAICREFPPVPFSKDVQAGLLVVETQCIRLTYDQKPFSPTGLSVELKGAYATYASIWHYGDAPDTLKGTARTLDKADGAIALEEGLMSVQGYAALDDTNSMRMDAQGNLLPADGRGIDMYLFAYGHDYAACLRDYLHLSGRTQPLPRYALGNWWSRFYPYTQEGYKALMERFAQEQVPLCVSVIDMNWHVTDIDPKYGPGWTGYTWDKEKFPDPARLLGWLHDKGLRVTLNDHPADGVRACEEMYVDMAREMGMDPAEGKPMPFDAGDPAYLRAFEKCVLEPYEQMGVDFWWIDWQQQGSSSVPGMDPLFVLNHTRYLHALREGKSGLTFSRYGGPGSQRYPVGFSGDSLATWQSLAFQPYFTATAANIAYGWWSHDIGGHMHGIRDDELAVRWLQFGVFSPIMRLHSSPSDFMRKEPWSYPARACGIMEEFLRLRHRLLPWLYTQNVRTSEECGALLRPLYYDYPDEWGVYSHRNEYLLGDALLISPIVEPAEERTGLAAADTWLPEGEWFDFFSGWQYGGGREAKLYRPMERIPVLARAGAIVPMDGAKVLENGAPLPETVCIRVFAGADGEAMLIEDNGQMPGDCAYRRVNTRFLLDWGDEVRFEILPAQGEVSLIPPARRYVVELYGWPEVEPDEKSCDYIAQWNAMRRVLTLTLDAQVEQGVQLCWRHMSRTAAFDAAYAAKELLMPVKMEHDVKDEIMRVITRGKDKAECLAGLQRLRVSDSLFGALTELFTVR